MTVREQLQAKYGAVPNPVAPPATSTTPNLSVRQQLEAKYKQPAPVAPVEPPKPVVFKYPIVETKQEKFKRATDQAAQAQKEAKDASSFWSLVGKPLLDTVAPSEGALGETIGGIIGTQRYSGDYAQRIQAMSNQNLAVAKKIRETEAKGKDATNLKRQYNSTVDLIEQNKAELAKLTKPTEKTNLQVGGEIAGTALDLLTAGTYGKATAGMKSGVLAPIKTAPTVLGSLAQPVEQRAGLFTGQGVKNVVVGGAKGAGIGYGYDLSQNAQAGKTGADLLTPGVGTVLGGALGAGSELALGAERSVLNGVDKVKNSPLVKDTIGSVKSKIGSKPDTIVQDNLKNLQTLEDSYSTVRKTLESSKSKGIDAKKILAESDLMVGSVDNTGTIRTKKALSDLNDFIAPQEKVVGDALKRENKLIPLQKVKDALLQEVDNSKVKGGAKLRAIANAEADIEGLKLDSIWADSIPKDQRTIENANVPLSVIHDAKIDKTSNINYLNPESKRVDKAIARAFKKLVEGNTSSVDVKKLNGELSSYYSVQDLLKKLDGKKVRGGKLGKYFSQIIGGAVGSHFGPVGTIVGAEVGGKIRGGMMKSKFSRPSGAILKESEAMQRALELNKGKLPQSSESLPSLKNAQTKQTTIKSNVPITNLLPKKENIVKKALNDQSGFAKLPGKVVDTTGPLPKLKVGTAGTKDLALNVEDIKELDTFIRAYKSKKPFNDTILQIGQFWADKFGIDSQDISVWSKKFNQIGKEWTLKAHKSDNMARLLGK